jgi:hypothetical protein
MPSVTFDGQSFSVKGRRVWLCARELHATTVPPERWGDRLREIRHAGFNAVAIACPWQMHEARRGRFRFDGSLDLARLLGLCREQGLWVILRIGPVVGSPYPNGGLPAWLGDLPGIRLRQPESAFFECVTAWFGALGRVCSGWLATDDRPSGAARAGGVGDTGPVIAVQVEQDWRCGREDLAESYLGELVRFAREVGFAVPILTANGCFAMVDAAIETLEAGDEALTVMRQLAALRPGHPRIAMIAHAADAERTAAAMTLALAGGAQCILRDPTPDARPLLLPSPIRRVAGFASGFGHVLAQARSERPPIVIDPEHRTPGDPPSVIPLTGDGGTALFVVRGASAATGGSARQRPTMPLLLGDGRAMRVSLGSAPIAWFLFDADLGGRSRLDSATAVPFALVDRSIVAFVAPAGEEVIVSIDGTMHALTAPPSSAGPKPAVKRVGDAARSAVIVVCNEAQADAAIAADGALVIGAERIDATGRVTLATGFRGAVRIGGDGAIVALAKDAIAQRPAPLPATSITGWVSVPMTEFTLGTSHRFANLGGPASLASCGAREGYGWYRIRLRKSAAAKLSLHLPLLAERALAWFDGEAIGTLGRGVGGAKIERKVSAGEHQIVLLVESSGERSRPGDIGRRGGLFGPALETAPVKAAPRIERGVHADPFALGFVYELHAGDARPGIALLWKLGQRTDASFVLEMDERVREHFTGGTITVNGTPVARWNAGGPEGAAVLIRTPRVPPPKGASKAAKTAAAKAPPVAGDVEIRLVLDHAMDDAALAALAEALALNEVRADLGAVGDSMNPYAFARWGPPPVWAAPSAKTPKGVPVWSRATFVAPARLSDAVLEAAGLGRGALFLNGDLITRFERETSIVVAAERFVSGTNEIVLFDESGSPPKSMTLRWE